MTRKTKLSDSPWFPHDVDTTADIKIVALLGAFGAPGYAVFWRLIESLHDIPGHALPLEGYVMEGIASQLKLKMADVQEIAVACCDRFDLFKLEDNKITSKRVFRNTEAKKESLELKREAANKRWSGRKNDTSKSNADAMQVHSTSKPDAKRKQSKGNASAMQNDAQYSTVQYILSEGERMYGSVPVSEQGAHATIERLLGAFVSAWPRQVSADEKKLIAEKFERVGDAGIRDYLESLSVNLDQWDDELTVAVFLDLYDPTPRP